MKRGWTARLEVVSSSERSAREFGGSLYASSMIWRTASEESNAQ